MRLSPIITLVTYDGVFNAGVENHPTFRAWINGGAPIFSASDNTHCYKSPITISNITPDDTNGVVMYFSAITMEVMLLSLRVSKKGIIAILRNGMSQ